MSGMGKCPMGMSGGEYVQRGCPDAASTGYKCKKNCCFITMCKAHSKVTHIKQQNYFHHLMGRGYNKNSVLYPGRLR